MTENKRIESLDLLRGLALILIILFHTSIYNFANIHKLDFSSPPVIVIIMSFMALWGGIFIIYSMAVNTIMTVRRTGEVSRGRLLLWAVFTGSIYLVLHYILNIVTGRWNIDFVNNQPHFTLIAGTLRNHQVTVPAYQKFFEGSSISTIAWNLIILSVILFFMKGWDDISRRRWKYLILGTIGSAIMLLSFTRVALFHYFADAVDDHSILTASILSFVISNPYPLLPYLGYGFIGTMMRMMIVNSDFKALKRVCLPLGLLFFIYGIAGMMQYDKTISKPDYFWYFKTQFELGVFIMLILFFIRVLGSFSFVNKRLEVIRWFSRVSLSVYMIEAVTSELLRFVWFRLGPDWDQTINGCLTFGFFNILFWIIVLFFWSRVGFRYSLEYFIVKLFGLLGKSSTRLDGVL